MPNNPDRITVAGEFDLYVAPNSDGSVTLPLDSQEALDPSFVAVGLTTRDGSAFETTPEFRNVESHQSQFPTRTFRVKQTGIVRAALQEWSDDNFITAFGGGSITEVGTGTATGEFRYDPPAGSGSDIVAAVLELKDGGKTYRFVIETLQAQSPVNLPFTPDAETSLPLELSILGDGSAAPWHLLTNDPAFDPAS